MSVRRHLQDRDDTELDMTPMLDIVFIMLIFFIVTTSFVKESGVEVNSPEISTADKQDDSNIFIAITDKNAVWLDKREVDIRTVRAIVSRIKTQLTDTKVVIQADKQASADTLLQVMDQVRLAGIDDIAVAAKSTNNSQR